jgi:hypothetical protein
MGFNSSDYQFILHNSATTFRSTVETLLIFETGLLPPEICSTYVLAILYIDYGYHEVDVCLINVSLDSLLIHFIV